MGLQEHFKTFHDKIKLDYDTNAELRDKRDILCRILSNSDKLPSFEILNQGSYSMYTGVVPLEGKEYDIDVGLRFNVCKNDHDPLYFKEIIQDILKDHTEYGAEIKKPCVTVTYKKDGEAAFHVDLVTYTYENPDDHNSQLYLARGKNSASEDACWERSDPKGLIDYIQDKPSAHKEQFRRVVRYLKRWKNLKFSSLGHAEPPSIGITLMAADYYYNHPYTIDENNDIQSLINVCEYIASEFNDIGTTSTGKTLYRIRHYLPFTLRFEHPSDVFSKMSDIQCTDFKEKLDKLISDLKSARDEADEVEQCKILHRIFGDDFEVPDAKDVSKPQRNYIPSSSASGV